MKKLVKLSVAALVAVSFGGLTATTADAATWHKGLPKIVRNKMYRTKFDMPYPNDPQYTWYKGTKSTLMEHATQSGAPYKLSKTKYKKVGKVYGYVRVRKLSNKKIKIADGKKTTKYEGKYVTMQRFYHFPRVNGRVRK